MLDAEGEVWQFNAMSTQARTRENTLVLDAKHSLLLKASAVCLWVILTGAAAQMKIWLPFTPVPMTLQTGVVMLGGLLLGKYGFFAQVAYVILGGIGLPLFAVDLPGVKAVWGPTGGYLVGFIFASYLTYRFVHHGWNQLRFSQKFFRLLAISLVIFAPGVLVLAKTMNVSIARALEMGFYPFILGDLLKTLLVSLTPSTVVKKSKLLFS